MSGVGVVEEEEEEGVDCDAAAADVDSKRVAAFPSGDLDSDAMVLGSGFDAERDEEAAGGEQETDEVDSKVDFRPNTSKPLLQGKQQEYTL